MSKTAQNARSFLKNAAKSDSGFVESFESVSPIQIPSIAIPINVKLSREEEIEIEKILFEDYLPGTLKDDLVTEHFEELKTITKQIKSISAQSILLHGERIQQAHNLLANYREGAFTKWLMATYGNRQTPYSMLRYYEFVQRAPKESRAMIEAAPKKGVYLLASREGDDRKKLDLIQTHGGKKQSDFLQAIQCIFPTTESSKRKAPMISTLESMDKLCSKLESRAQQLSDDDRLDIKKLIQRLQKL